MSVGALAVLASSCADDLNTEFLGGYVTTEQKEETLGMDPEKALAGVTGSFTAINQYGAVYDNHFDFGYPSIMMGMDMQTEDFLGLNSGYNWHANWEEFTRPNSQGVPTTMMWNYLYKQILSANALIATIDNETENEELMFYLANGLAIRAWDYFTLIQAYQFNYTVNPNALGLPIITEENSEEAAANGIARSTVADAYAQIEKDIDLAIALFENSSVTPADVIDSKPKRLFSLASAYGLRARIHLVKHEYAKAAEYAQKAIDAFDGAPYSLAEVSKPAFNSLDDHAWMWGLAIAETDRVVTTGICNWGSFACSFAYGYVTVGSWKYCGFKLYSYIPDTDVRKGWFLDDNYTSPNLSATQQAYLNTYINPDGLDFNRLLDGGMNNDAFIVPQTNVKFNSFQSVLGQTVNATDVPFMRIEEMYYTKAEGQAMSGNPTGGLQTLTDFVKAYRNPSYAFAGTSAEEIQEEIWWQRRAEFWGEGLAYFDLMRLNKGIDRRQNRTPYAFRFNIQPLDPVLIYCLPEREITSNPLISESDNNTSASKPTSAD